jgi:hypothetical protein
MGEQAFDPNTDADITGLEWWRVLVALHRGTSALGLGRLHDRELGDDMAKLMIEAYKTERHALPRFDYVFGRPLKVGFRTDGTRSWVTRVDLYDRDSKRPARAIIAELYKS